MDADVIVVGAGLAGLVATAELADAGRTVILVDQEPETNLGGQAFWSFGGLFLVDSPEQRRMGIKDSRDLAWQDWLGHRRLRPRARTTGRARWAEAYVDFAAGEKRAWLHEQGMRCFPVVGWAERGGYLATGHGNSVPRFHVTWGTGPGVVDAVRAPRARGGQRGLVTLRFRHRVDELIAHGGVRRRRARRGPGAQRGRARCRRPRARWSATSSSPRRRSSSPPAASAATTTWSGRTGRHGSAPRRRDMVTGVPGARGRPDARRSPRPPAATSSTRTGCGTTSRASATGTRSGRVTASGSCPGRRRCGSTRPGRRLPVPLFPGFDTLGTLEHLRTTGHDHSWFVLTQKIIEKEFALSGSEQNPDLTGKSVRQVLGRVRPGAPGPVEAFKQHGEDFVVRRLPCASWSPA